MFLRHAVALLALFLTGCSSVSSTVPLGQPVADEKAKALEGVWLVLDGDPLMVKHIAKNELRIGFLEWKDDHFAATELKVLVGEDQQRLYINVVDPDAPADAPKYGIASLIEAEDDYVLLVPPNAEAFEKAIAAGVLLGAVERKRASTEVKLASPAEKLIEFVDPALAGSQFHINAPLVLHRVQRFEEKEASQ